VGIYAYVPNAYESNTSLWGPLDFFGVSCKMVLQCNDYGNSGLKNKKNKELED
jgi:hypothetical protein